MASDKMSQSEVDALIKGLRGDGEYNELKYHLLICRHCRNVIASTSLDLHTLFTAKGYKSNEYGHAYYSEELLRERLNLDIASKPRIKKVLKSK